jgi:uncharacterized protein YqgV (UPF0045/DUF77 family)
MNDRPDFDPEKAFETIRAQWTKDSYLSLPSKLEARLTLIEEQLSTLFQLVEKLLHEAMDQTIDSDVNKSKFRIIDTRLKALEQIEEDE